MKKLYLSMAAILLSSCGNYEMTGNRIERVGEILPLTSRELTTTDRNNLSVICNAFRQKEAILPSTMNTLHTFSINQTDCEGNLITNEKTQVTIQSGLLGYFFKRVSDGQDFIFPQIETTQSGVLKEACDSLNTLSNPLMRENNVTYLTTTGILTSDCSPAYGEVCVKLDQAFVQGEQALVHTKEWLRVRVSSPDGKYIGFVTQRKKVTRSYCGRNEALTFGAKLETN